MGQGYGPPRVHVGGRLHRRSDHAWAWEFRAWKNVVLARVAVRDERGEHRPRTCVEEASLEAPRREMCGRRTGSSQRASRPSCHLEAVVVPEAWECGDLGGLGAWGLDGPGSSHHGLRLEEEGGAHEGQEGQEGPHQR